MRLIKSRSYLSIVQSCLRLASLSISQTPSINPKIQTNKIFSFIISCAILHTSHQKSHRHSSLHRRLWQLALAQAHQPAQRGFLLTKSVLAEVRTGSDVCTNHHEVKEWQLRWRQRGKRREMRTSF